MDGSLATARRGSTSSALMEPLSIVSLIVQDHGMMVFFLTKLFPGFHNSLKVFGFWETQVFQGFLGNLKELERQMSYSHQTRIGGDFNWDLRNSVLKLELEQNGESKT